MKINATKNFLDNIRSVPSFIDNIKLVRCWIKYHFCKDFLNIIKVCLKGYPWDERCLLNIERAKLIEMANYQERVKRFEGWEYVVRDIRLAVKLIDIILGEGFDLFHFDGDIYFEKCSEHDYEMKHTSDFKYVCDIYVNTKNVSRFVKNGQEDFYTKSPHELYLIKARYLYFKMRYEHGAEWWD